jgi:hypothetical protein
MLNVVFGVARFDDVAAAARNPLSRIVSEYKMLLMERGNPPSMGAWIERILSDYTTPHLHVRQPRLPQSELLVPGCKTFKLEAGSMDRWIATLTARSGIESTARRAGHATGSPPLANATVPAPAVAARTRAMSAQGYGTLGYARALSEPP